MNCSDNNNCSSCISDILQKILLLQKQNFNNDSFVGCDKPYLGPSITTTCYNTRPIQLYNCCNGTPWSFSYESCGTEETSSTLRVESLDECCCTCRILGTDATTGEYTNTGEFVTIDLKCCGAIRCFPDTSIDLCS